jgi:hypothetical protein
MTSRVAIPFFSKVNPQDMGCAPICLKMALHHFGIEWTLDQIHRATNSFGPKHYTLPWGICLGAAAAGVSIVFISKQPRSLLPRYLAPIAAEAGCRSEEVGSIAADLITHCEKCDRVRLTDWQDLHGELPKRILSSSTYATEFVLIPTLWWKDFDAHNVVITGMDENRIYLHDPNQPDGADTTMPLESFYEDWINNNTDNDLLLISAGPPGNGFPLLQ